MRYEFYLRGLAGTFGNYDAVRFCDALQARRKVRRLANDGLFLSRARSNQVANNHSTRGSRGGSDAAPTGPQASKSVRGVIGHQLNLTKMQLSEKR